jgi:phosphoribosylamine--glycine ligase
VVSGEPPGLVFHSGTTVDADGLVRTNGGRVLTAVGRGADLESARGAAERLADAIDFDGVQRRRDIARDLPAQPVGSSRSIPAGVPA